MINDCRQVNITRLPSPFGPCMNASEADPSLNVYQQLHSGVEYSALVITTLSTVFTILLCFCIDLVEEIRIYQGWLIQKLLYGVDCNHRCRHDDTVSCVCAKL